MAISGAVLKVDPEKMHEQATVVRDLCREMETNFKTIEDVMSRTANYWIGEAGDKHRKIYDNQKEDISTMLKRLSEHPDDLDVMSENYRSAETKNVEVAVALPGDAIS